VRDVLGIPKMPRRAQRERNRAYVEQSIFGAAISIRSWNPTLASIQIGDYVALPATVDLTGLLISAWRSSNRTRGSTSDRRFVTEKQLAGGYALCGIWIEWLDTKDRRVHGTHLCQRMLGRLRVRKLSQRYPIDNYNPYVAGVCGSFHTCPPDQ